jgi:hypothetical protein
MAPQNVWMKRAGKLGEEVQRRAEFTVLSCLHAGSRSIEQIKLMWYFKLREARANHLFILMSKSSPKIIIQGDGNYRVLRPVSLIVAHRSDSTPTVALKHIAPL